MTRTPIYTTGDGRDKQYAMRADGVWFSRLKRKDAPGWHAWQPGAKPLYGLYIDARAGSARLPGTRNGRAKSEKRPREMWYDAL